MLTGSLVILVAMASLTCQQASVAGRTRNVSTDCATVAAPAELQQKLTDLHKVSVASFRTCKGGDVILQKVFNQPLHMVHKNLESVVTKDLCNLLVRVKEQNIELPQLIIARVD